MIEVAHADPEIARLETEPVFTAGFDKPVVKGYRKAMQIIRSVSQKTVLYRFNGLHFEQLSGKRAHEHSVRLNKKWRLIMEFSGAPPEERVLIKGIENHYGD